jgi:hypothetical protein
MVKGGEITKEFKAEAVALAAFFLDSKSNNLSSGLCSAPSPIRFLTMLLSGYTRRF